MNPLERSTRRVLAVFAALGVAPAGLAAAELRAAFRTPRDAHSRLAESR